MAAPQKGGGTQARSGSTSGSALAGSALGSRSESSGTRNKTMKQKKRKHPSGRTRARMAVRFISPMPMRCIGAGVPLVTSPVCSSCSSPTVLRCLPWIPLGLQRSTWCVVASSPASSSRQQPHCASWQHGPAAWRHGPAAAVIYLLRSALTVALRSRRRRATSNPPSARAQAHRFTTSPPGSTSHGCILQYGITPLVRWYLREPSLYG